MTSAANQTDFAMQRVRVWKQDPSVAEIAVRPALLIGEHVGVGPSDTRIETHVDGVTPIAPSPDGDFLFDQHVEHFRFDAVHTFAVVRRTLDMFERAMRLSDPDFMFSPAWGTGERLRVEPHAEVMLNAYYSRSARALRFGYFEHKEQTIFICRSADIVAHEAGHWLLDGLKPAWSAASVPQTGALHESFGDLMAIFTMLLQFDMTDEIVIESRGDLHDATFLKRIGEQFGNALGRPTGLRNADNDLTLDQVSNEVHELSNVFTGAIFDIIADLFALNMDVARYHPNETLYRSAQHVLALVLQAIVEAPIIDADFWDVAEIMIASEPLVVDRQVIIDQFTRRGIVAGRMNLIAQSADYSKCCETLRRA